MRSDVVGQVFTSCTSGAPPCNDAGSVMVGPPLWVDLIGLVVVIAVAVIVVRLIVRAVRRRRGSAAS